MRESKMGREKVSIYGTGGLAKKLFCQLSEIYEIVVFYNSSSEKWGKTLMGIPIQKFETKEAFIIIASKDWKEISSILVEQGLKPIQDFLPFWMIADIIPYEEVRKYYTEEQTTQYISWLKRNRRIALLYGNCQTGIMMKILAHHVGFRNDYLILEVPAVFQFASEKEIEQFLDDKVLWGMVDLLIYQEVRKDNRFSPRLASDEIIGRVRAECQKVRIVNVFFDGYFPQLKPVRKRWGVELHQSGLFPFGDQYVDQLVQEGKPVDEIVQIVSSEDFLRKDDIKAGCEDSINELSRREHLADVKICDYIRSEVYSEGGQMFFSTNHPHNRLLYEYANRILCYLGYQALPDISEEDMNIQFGTLKGQDIPIYPSVIRCLGIKGKQTYFPNRYLREGYLLNFQTYIEKYIQYIWCGDTVEEM